MASFVEREQGSSGIQWGSVAGIAGAGAAAATGVVVAAGSMGAPIAGDVYEGALELLGLASEEAVDLSPSEHMNEMLKDLGDRFNEAINSSKIGELKKTLEAAKDSFMTEMDSSFKPVLDEIKNTNIGGQIEALKNLELEMAQKAASYSELLEQLANNTKPAEALEILNSFSTNFDADITSIKDVLENAKLHSGMTEFIKDANVDELTRTAMENGVDNFHTDSANYDISATMDNYKDKMEGFANEVQNQLAGANTADDKILEKLNDETFIQGLKDTLGNSNIPADELIEELKKANVEKISEVGEKINELAKDHIEAIGKVDWNKFGEGLEAAKNAEHTAESRQIAIDMLNDGAGDLKVFSDETLKADLIHSLKVAEPDKLVDTVRALDTQYKLPIGEINLKFDASKHSVEDLKDIIAEQQRINTGENLPWPNIHNVAEESGASAIEDKVGELKKAITGKISKGGRLTSSTVDRLTEIARESSAGDRLNDIYDMLGVKQPGILSNVGLDTVGGAAATGLGLKYLYDNPPGSAIRPASVDAARVENATMDFRAQEQMRAVDTLMQQRMATFGGPEQQPGPALG